MHKSSNGQNMAEWGIAVLLISVIVMSALFMLVPSTKGILNTISNAMDNGLNEN